MKSTAKKARSTAQTKPVPPEYSAKTLNTDIPHWRLTRESLLPERQHLDQVPLLFAQGVDSGAELILPWLEQEFDRFEKAQLSLPQMLASLRIQFRERQRFSFTRHVLQAKRKAARSKLSSSVSALTPRERAAHNNAK